MQSALAEKNATSELLTIEGAGHAFTPQQNDQRVLPAMVGWFEKHLVK
jgi:dipeptidyl aminopeptidase/acylaminoacyl peptidase